ncbi:class I SAM-dependent methyltransferase [Devosia sp. SD17-2]|uniref:class I SAM-dependent methyltransferase n=1 Tax=Devosia sp. SD17-2 TaxID=2976459 RepID=UPI0023D883BB|nr:class I SAM-dependent methyltransferase [Devosia sp. SD17-2]WEJ35083.1 class I SAM-dependent methyltransferase [Devosia sp. SD17-2]
MKSWISEKVGTQETCELSLVLDQRLLDLEGITLRGILDRDPRLRCASPRLCSLMQRAASPTSENQQQRLVQMLAEGMARFMTEQFQYTDFTLPELKHLYADFVVELSAAWHVPSKLRTCLQRHHDKLAVWVASRLEDIGALELVRDTGFQPICANYSPEVQLDVLGLNHAKMMEPVLDLGCGDGRLVHHLQLLGFDAVGIDRIGPRGMTQGDWFDAPLPPGHWGTIIAHQSVSLHFQSAHMRSAADATCYARLFMRILGALKPGGCFAYAPAVPFLEKLLRRDYRLSRNQVAAGIVSTRLVRWE